jgi:SAM-dependent methyltransferase
MSEEISPVVNFEDLLGRSVSLQKSLEEADVGEDILQNLRGIQTDIAALLAAERGSEDKRPLPDYLFDLLRATLRKNRIRSGLIAEIGGSKNSFLPRLGKFDVRYLSIFPSNDPQYIVADICNCPQVPSESFDLVFSVSVLEHVQNVHDAAREITRILKPGGITMHAVPFSYFFHGAPEDYWRLTTTALETLFAELEPIDCFFYAGNRRRNNLGSSGTRVDQDGGPKFAPDAFGGWRENWTSVFVGRKVPNGAELLLERRMKQTLVNVIKGLIERGASEDDAITRALLVIRHISFNEHGRMIVDKEPKEQRLFDVGFTELKELWIKRGKKTFRPSAARPTLMALLTHAGLV